jgi:hypothetical protein
VPIGTVTFRSGPRQGRSFGLTWDAGQALNGHMVLVGGSGSGKTFQLRRILSDLAHQGMRVHVIDPHGDLDLGSSLTDSRTFSDSTPFGLNPLEVSDDPLFGGVRRQANAFVNLLLRQATLGEKQKGALFRELIDLYARYGFDMDDPRTWALSFDPRTWARQGKRHPTLSDLSRAVWDRCVAMKVGVAGAAARKFEEVARLQAKAYRLRLKKARGEEVEAALAKAKADFLAAMGEALERMETGRELEDLVAWDSFDVVKGLHERLVGLERSGIFKGRAAEFDAGRPVWRYAISPLSRDEQQFFVDCLLMRLFHAAKARGEADGPDTAIVLDEASIFVDRDDDHILNILFREARKFGVMVILAAQEISMFPPAILSSAATKLILGVDDMYHRATEDRLGLERGRLKWLKPQRTALVQLKRRPGEDDSLGQGFYEVELGRGG